MIYTDIYKKDQYLSNYYPYIINSMIRDYDISKANINILKYLNYISKEEYDYYYNLPKRNREIEVGLFLRDNPNISKELSKGFLNCRKEFFDINNIQEIDVLSIEKDSIKLINKIPTYTSIFNNSIEFINKGTYTSFYRIDINKRYHYRFFYTKDIISNYENIIVKGIANDIYMNKVEPLHRNYLLDFLYFIFESIIIDNIEDTINYLTIFISRYVSLDLDLGYYREFNRDSQYIISHKDRRISADFFTEENKEYLYIGFNLSILNTLLEYFSNEYFKKKKKSR